MARCHGGWIPVTGISVTGRRPLGSRVTQTRLRLAAPCGDSDSSRVSLAVNHWQRLTVTRSSLTRSNLNLSATVIVTVDLPAGSESLMMRRRVTESPPGRVDAIFKLQ